MIDHTGLSVSDFDRALVFYEAALKPMGGGLLMMLPEEMTGGEKVCGLGRDEPTFWINEGPVQAPRLHVAFAARNRAEVDAFHAAALAAGGRDNGAPGVRPHYHESYYAAFVLAPDGNNIEAVCHRPPL